MKPALICNGFQRNQKNNHNFLVISITPPKLNTNPVESMETESVFKKATQVIAWRNLQDDGVRLQGWI